MARACSMTNNELPVHVYTCTPMSAQGHSAPSLGSFGFVTYLTMLAFRITTPLPSKNCLIAIVVATTVRTATFLVSHKIIFYCEAVVHILTSSTTNCLTSCDTNIYHFYICCKFTIVLIYIQYTEYIRLSKGQT